MKQPSRPEPTGWGTQRRLRALASRGWSAPAIQRATGIAAADITTAINDSQDACRDLNNRVAAAYDQLWNQPPPHATPHDQITARTARTEAGRRGWPPPMAWDDEVIDRPDGQPAPGWKPSARPVRRAADLVEDAEWVRQHDGYRQAPLSQVAMRLGVTHNALAKAHERTAGREAEAG